jgi:hypothetical protein
LKSFVTSFFTVISIALFAIRFVFVKNLQGMHHGFVHLMGRVTASGFKVHPNAASGSTRDSDQAPHFHAPPAIGRSL